MSAKKKSKAKDRQADPNLESNQNSELEKKVDAMMSVEETDAPAEEASTPSENEEAPLLPTDKLPDLDQAPEQQSEEVSDDSPLPPTAPELPGSEENEESSESEEPVTPEPEQTQPAADYKPTPVKYAESSEQEAPKKPGELSLYDAKTNSAVDDIAAAEADGKTEDFAASPPKKEFTPSKAKKNPFKVFITSKTFRTLIVLLILGGLGAIIAVPKTRYLALNTAGVRSTSSVHVLDESTGQPLKNAEFSLANVTGKTNEEGDATLSGLKLGPTNLKITKTAFAEVDQPVTVGWGSNPLGDFKLKAVGAQYKFKVTDFLSKKPIAKAEASSGEASAQSNEKGEITLTVPQSDKEKVDIEIKATGYRTEKLNQQEATKDATEIQMVPSKKIVFVSKRSGRYDVYKVDADGKNEEKVLPGNGSEQLETMSLSSHPTKNIAVLVSSRDNIRNPDGTNLNTLTLLDLDDNTSKTVTQSQRIQIIGWDKDRIIYVKVTDNSKNDSNDRHKIMSYDTSSESEKELASSNYFNDATVVKDEIYYSPAAYQVNGAVGLYKINADGSNKKTVYDKEVWSILRTTYDRLNVSIGQDWYEVNLDNDAMTPLNGSPAVQKTRLYVDGPGSTSLWLEDRDGKGNLIAYDQKTKQDKVLQVQAGLKNPVRWLDEKHVIFRVNNNQETADYILNLEGGEARKVKDVTDTSGVDRWYYY